MTEQEICDGILQLHKNPQLREQMVENLQNAPKGNEQELEQYVKRMF